MKRWFVLAGLLAVGSFSIAVAGIQAPPSGPSAVALAATKIEKVKDNLYMITGSGLADPNAFSGGNTGVFITDTGVVVVDTKLPGWGPTILQRIKSVTNKPVTTIINTHTHSDHTGSNEFFGAMVDSVVQENTKANMVKMDEFKGEKARFLPRRTYKDKLTMGSGKDEIDLYYFGPAHTSGDTFVVFPALRTIHAGDVFAWKALPYIDTDNGGDAFKHAETLSKVIKSVKNVDTVITGHITTPLPWADLKEYADFSADFGAFATKEMKAGKTVDQAAAEYKIPAKFKGYVVTVDERYASAKMNLQKAYDELKKK